MTTSRNGGHAGVPHRAAPSPGIIAAGGVNRAKIDFIGRASKRRNVRQRGNYLPDFARCWKDLMVKCAANSR
jgi:hypothetical protein